MMKTFVENTGFYSTCWILFFFLLGILVYILDRQYLKGLYKSFYDMIHKDPLTEPRAFIFGQKTARKFLWAFVVSTVQSFFLFFFTGFHSNPFVELVLWFVEIPMMVFGFGAGSLLWPLWLKRSVMYRMGDEVGDRVEKWKEQRNAARAKPAPAPVAAPVTPVPAAPAEPVVPPEERIRQYTRKQ